MKKANVEVLKAIKPAKVEALDPALMHARNKVVKELSAIDAEIGNRIDYIVKFICAAFGETFSYWDYNGSSSGSNASFDDAVIQNFVCIDWSPRTQREILFNGEKLQLTEYFPYAWLHENFEEDLIKGRALLQQSIADKKVQHAKRALEKAEEEKALIDSVKIKLTPNELKALLKKKNQKGLK